ncbi:predicted protein [Paecilomyces variotii No. 5]|uniref:CENP-V/GFA domain-containing protein n=1 Tax=Byssochlamys spectabilis (strain No. 5 / NBRC 109023) TaxID=1356009 RepID=V5GBA5_BYSSN|nr:predicted protein [Paecilomyces variotii No. 5]
MPGSGTCACGNVAFTYSGDPALTVLCHCSDCRKWTGSAFSSNVAVPTANFSITKGKPKIWTRLGLVSGKEHPHFFCGDCGTNLYSQPGGMPGTTLIKAGSLSDDNIAIAAELFTTRRRNYITPVGSAQQAEQMP